MDFKYFSIYKGEKIKTNLKTLTSWKKQKDLPF